MHATPRRHLPSSNGSDAGGRSCDFDQSNGSGSCTMSGPRLRLMQGIGIANRDARLGGNRSPGAVVGPEGSMAGACEQYFQRAPLAGRHRPLRHRDARTRRRRRYRSADAPRHAGAGRDSAYQIRHHRDRRKSRSGRGDLPHRTGSDRAGNLDPRAGEFLHQRACSCRAQRRKASGGCSAPAVKSDRTNIGEMRFRQLGQTPDAESNTRTAQIMIRHPNNSGLQMDQVTRLYIPPFFVHSLKVWQGDELLLLAMEGKHLDLRGSQHPLHLRP
jgi:hypothetical protein